MKKIILLALVASSSTFADTVLEEIDVVGHHGHQQNLLEFVPTSVTTLKGKELKQRRQTSLGDTLQSEAGVSSTSFGPNASRPVIRGLDGARVRVLQNGLGTLDASTQSVDHAIPIDPLLIDQIEIVRGPMSLLYGSSAVGGVVNVLTNRTHTQFEEGLLTEFQTQGETVNDGISSSARLDYGKDKWMIHFDGSNRNLQDTAVPGYARTKELRAADPRPDETKNTIPNSFNKQTTLGTGATKFFDKGHVGLSFGHVENQYGAVAEENVSIDMLQNRYELDAEYKTKMPLFHTLKLKSAQSDYRHKEIEDHATGTIFSNKGNESRFEGLNGNGNVKGVSGIHTQIFDFKASGEEAFLPGTGNRIVSFFTFQELTRDRNVFSLGVRAEDTFINKPESTVQFGDKDKFNFFGLNGSLAYTYKLDKENSLSFSYSYTERAPNFQELLSNGPHLATGTFEIGDDQLTKEKSHATELSYKRETEKQTINTSIYRQTFDNFITLSPTGTTQDDLPVFVYNQKSALFYGLDVDTKTRLDNYYSFIGRFDYVFAKQGDGHYLPRISPPRITAGLEHEQNNWTTDLDVQYVFEQNKTAPNEDSTDRYILTNIGTQYALMFEGSKLDIFFRIRNIFDVEARSHVSTLKDIAPLPGRNFILGAQWLI